MIGEDNPLNYLLDDLVVEGHHPDWAIVTSVDPLRVRKDHEANALEVTPQSLVRDLAVGDRVLLAEWQGQPVILGTGGGPPQTYAPMTLGSGQNLNNYDVSGVWHQRANVSAESGQNYPVPYAGLLEVHADGQMVYQVYTTYNQQGRYWRSKYQSTWQPWQMVAVDGGDEPAAVEFLGEADLPEAQSGSITVPEHVRGQFAKYTLTITAAATSVDSLGTRPVSLRVNGDGGENYRSNATLFEGGTVKGGYNNSAAYPRTMYIGLYESSVELTFIPRSKGATNYGAWTATGFINSGASPFYTFVSSGRWQGDSTQEIASFQLLTNTSSAHFKPGGTIRMWGHR